MPDAVRYALMAWPELPDPDKPELSEAEQNRWDAFDEKTRRDIEEMKRITDRKRSKSTELQPHEDGYPGGNVFQQDVVEDNWNNAFEGDFRFMI